MHRDERADRAQAGEGFGQTQHGAGEPIGCRNLGGEAHTVRVHLEAAAGGACDCGAHAGSQRCDLRLDLLPQHAGAEVVILLQIFCCPLLLPHRQLLFST